MQNIPRDFPRRVVSGSLSGAGPKLALRLAKDGTYTNFVSDEEQLLIYENTEHLARSLKAYVQREALENPECSRDSILSGVEKALAQKYLKGQWDVEPPEQDWIMRRITVLLV